MRAGSEFTTRHTRGISAVLQTSTLQLTHTHVQTYTHTQSIKLMPEQNEEKGEVLMYLGHYYSLIAGRKPAPASEQDGEEEQKSSVYQQMKEKSVGLYKKANDLCPGRQEIGISLADAYNELGLWLVLRNVK